jgi:bifunctional DNase/RNase
MPEKKIRLNIIGLSYSQTQTGAYALILGEETGKRRLPVIIGTSEAQAIAVQLEGLTPYRPLTHDLFLSMASAFHIELIEVNIVKLEEGVFFSELVCMRDNAKVKIDSRTSDAIALALRFKCPIFVKEDIIRRAGIFIDDKTGKFKSSDSDVENPDSMDEYSLDELKKMMQTAIEAEDYEKASELRDLIKYRESSQTENKEDNIE